MSLIETTKVKQQGGSIVVFRNKYYRHAKMKQLHDGYERLGFY